MKKSLLSTGLLSFLSATAQADLGKSTIDINPANSVQIEQEISLPAPKESGLRESAAIHGAQLSQNDSSSVKNPITLAAQSASAKPAPTPPATPAPAATTAPASIVAPPPAENKPAAPVVIDCNYHIPAETAHIEQSVIVQWAEKATQQSFDFDHVNMTQQLSALKSCYTDQGWESFNEALQKSGNVNAIQSQKLVVSSMVNGKPAFTEVKENQWKISLPLQVVYQNEKEKLTQALTVDLIVGRKISGDLGIMQMIASPRQANTQTVSDTPATAEKQP